MRPAILIARFAALLAVAIFSSCTASPPPAAPPFIEYGKFQRPISFPMPGAEVRARFNAMVPGIKDSVVKNDTTVIRGFRTRNREFLAEVITPLLKPALDSLRRRQPAEIINALAIFGHELFSAYFGSNFYRWGGDINDLDDPQENRTRFGFAYGLDCSGYATLPYELAVHFGLIDSLSEGALFSSAGFARYCRLNHFRDRGGRGPDSTNNFRPDTEDLRRIGKEVFSIARGGAPTDEQMLLAQPGDLVVRRGHVGMLVLIEGELYYLESGGRVVPRTGGNPAHAREALELFAQGAPLSVRRALPELHPSALTAL